MANSKYGAESRLVSQGFWPWDSKCYWNSCIPAPFLFTISEPVIIVRSNGVIWLSGMLTCHLYQAEGPLLVLSVLQMNPQDESEIGSRRSKMVITSRFDVCFTFSHKSAEAYSRQLEYCRRVSQKVVAFSGA
jgi:hypothetical protein